MSDTGFDIAEIGGHVKDGTAFHVPGFLWDWLPEALKGTHPHRGSIPLPSWHLGPWELPKWQLGAWDVGGHQIGPWEVLGYRVEFDWQLTRFMVLEVVAAVLMIVIFVPLAWRIRRGGRPRGLFWNFFEVMLVFIRDEVARPAIGRRDADRYLPFVWNAFFFILFCNLLGMIPWAGSPTGSLSVTAALALVAFCAVIGTGMIKHGLVGYWTGLVPPMELPLALALFLKPMLLVIEVAGLAIKHCVLAVRLLANIFAGHLVLAVILEFIAATAGTFVVLWLGVTIASVFAAAALSLLELFVAFLQAYVFAFLSALFIGMAIHQH
ncbi:MAG TPA: F0F1 ATP synthase subunit A [Thermoguttaceae bacterium]|nr:F0F1 ATP synthase subunit A [Thermoguttaceae bacterium]